MRQLPIVLLVTAACGGCGDDGGGAVDATPVIDIDNGQCGTQLRFTGELVDFDSSEASFCGVNGAKFEAGAMTSNTAPNGRFDLCVDKTSVTNVTVTPATTMSGCSSMPGTYNLPIIAVASPATIQAGAFFSGRAFTMQRESTLFTAVGAAFDASKAQVIVHVDGAQRGVALLASHATTQAFNGTTWAAGETGKDVFFPNVDVASGSTMLTVVGGAIGTGSIPLQAGKLTLVAVLAK